MAALSIGIVYVPCPEELGELEKAVSAITGYAPERERVFAYDGPNEVVQLLIDSAGWQHILYGLAAAFGGPFLASFGGELGKLTAAEVWKSKANYYGALKKAASSPFLAVISAVQLLRQKKQTVTLAVKVPHTPRNAGLVITSETSEELAWKLANIIRCSEGVKRVVEDAISDGSLGCDRQGGNPDLSIVIEVLDSGDVRVLGKVIRDV